jgi:gliding motility-associated-like protein
VCYGSSTNSNTLIYFSGTGGGNVYSFNGIDPQQQSNWSSASATTNQTPGAPNNAANAAYIAQFNNNCTPITPISVTATSVNAGCTCTGSATAIASGSIAGYTYEWFDASFVAIGQATATATGLCAGDYHVIATSSIGCTDTAHVTITSSGSTTVAVNSANICVGESTLLTATPSVSGGTFLWSPGGATTNTISVNPGSSQTYTVTYTLAGCSSTGTGLVTVNSLPVLVATSATVCSGQSATITASGANTYVWNTGVTTAGLTINPAAATTTYTVTGTNTATTCTNTATGTITVNSLPIVTSTSTTVCSGQSATITASGANSFVWNTGVTSVGLTINPATATTTYTVTGTNTATTCTNTAIGIISVTPNPTVTVNSETICTGGSATLTASGANSYTWNTGAIVESIEDNPLVTTTYTVVGTSLTCLSNPVTATITVIPSLSLSVNSATICVGQSATLVASGATSYLWSNGGATNSINVIPNATTIYTVTGTTGNCTGATTATVTVNTLPTVVATSATVCSGQSATLTASGADTYLWNGGSTSASITINPAISSIVYSVVGTNTLTSCSNSASGTVTIKPLPNVVATSTSVCSGDAATINASGADTYLWNTGITGAIFTINSATQTTTYTVVGTNTLTSCSNTTTGVITVNEIPIVSVNPQTICDGQTATLNASGASTYSWNSGETSSSISVNPNQTTTYTVNGSSAGCVATQTVQVIVNTAPAFDFSANILTGCPPLCIDFDDIIVAGGLSVTNYNWSFGDGAQTNFVDPTHCYTTSGLYDVGLNVNYSNGCVRSFVKSDYITIYNLPLANFTTNISSDPEQIDSDVEFTNLSSNASIYSWSFGDASFSNQIDPIHTYEQEGTYQVTLIATSSNGCIDSTKQELEIKGMFTFYAPNSFTPNGDNVNEIFLPTGSSWDSENYELLIFDRWGNEAFSTKDMNEGWNGKTKGGKEIAQIDTYVWKVKLRDAYGNAHSFHGIVNVIR